jgi:hypothetical protein
MKKKIQMMRLSSSVLVILKRTVSLRVLSRGDEKGNA